jgi:hypothetical protein
MTAPVSPSAPVAWRLVPDEITMQMRHFAWKQEYLDNGATDDEASIFAANREVDPEEVEGAKSAYRAMLAASPAPSIEGLREKVARIIDPSAFMFSADELDEKVYSQSRAHAFDRADQCLALLARGRE